MQSNLRLLILATLVAGFAHISAWGQLIVCPGEPVQFEVGGTYYGAKTWEFSADSLVWTPAEVEEESPFTITPEVAGWYRVRFEDVECGVTYFSNVVRLVWPDQLHLQTVFTNSTISSTIDPVLWLSDPDSLSDLVYVVNGTEYPVTLLYQPLPNPGIGFTVFARATNFMGCTVYSDTLTFFVEETNILGNGVVQPDAVVDLSGVLVNSSVDTASLDPDHQFSLNYNLDFIHDLLIASREVQGESRIVALRLALDPGEFLLMNEHTTAWSMVFSNPDVILLAADSADALRAWLEGRSDFLALTGAIQSDLEQLGYVDLNAADKVALVNALVSQILNEWVVDGFRDVGDGMYPFLSEGSGSSALQYSHVGINLVYATRFYHDGVPISEPVAFGGDGTPGIIQRTILNFMAYAFQINPSLSLRQSNELLISDITSDTQGLSSVDVRVVSGIGHSDSPETELAGDYNTIIYYYKVLSFLPIRRIMRAGAECVLNIGATIDNGYTEAQAQTTEVEIHQTALGMFAQLGLDVAQCTGNVLLSVFTGAISAVQNVGWYVQYFYDGLTRESEVVYGYTVINSKFHGQLLIESNSSEAFAGIPGSLTQPLPTLTLKERPLFIRQGLAWPIIGPVLHLSEPEYYVGSPSDDGFFFNGIMSGTESVRVNNGVTHTGLGFVDAFVSSTQNSFFWRLSGSVAPPSSAALVVQIFHSGQNLPLTIENYSSGSIVFNATIEQPVLSISSGNNQTGRPGAVLLQPCVVELRTQGGIAVGGYDVYVEILEGGGSASPLLATTNEVGQASVNWTLGDEGPQSMLVMVSPPGLGVLDDVTVTATSLDACAGQTALVDIDGNSYAVVSIGTDCWMAENLKTAHYRNGMNCNWVNYDNEPSYDAIYGKLYSWHVVSDTSGVCPTGWHVPSDFEWILFEWTMGMTFDDSYDTGGRGYDQDVGIKLKANSPLWSGANGGGQNTSGFTGLPGGYYDHYYHDFYSKGSRGMWWTSTAWVSGENALYRWAQSGSDGIWRYVWHEFDYGKYDKLSVRCIKD